MFRRRSPLRYLHYGEVPHSERAWIGAVPVTNPARTINDSLPDFIRQAIDQGLRRGLFSGEDVAMAEHSIASYR